MPLVFIFITLLVSNSFCAQEIPKNRTRILTDISTDSDNPQSLICLLLYLNVIDIKGISVTASLWQKIPVHSDLIYRAIEGYGKVQSNLAGHEVGFPSVKLLFPKVKLAQALYKIHKTKAEVENLECIPFRIRTTVTIGLGAIS